MQRNCSEWRPHEPVGFLVDQLSPRSKCCVSCEDAPNQSCERTRIFGGWGRRNERSGVDVRPQLPANPRLLMLPNVPIRATNTTRRGSDWNRNMAHPDDPGVFGPQGSPVQGSTPKWNSFSGERIGTTRTIVQSRSAVGTALGSLGQSPRDDCRGMRGLTGCQTSSPSSRTNGQREHSAG